MLPLVHDRLADRSRISVSTYGHRTVALRATRDRVRSTVANELVLVVPNDVFVRDAPECVRIPTSALSIDHCPGLCDLLLIPGVALRRVIPHFLGTQPERVRVVQTPVEG